LLDHGCTDVLYGMNNRLVNELVGDGGDGNHEDGCNKGNRGIGSRL
jgi:hypothetical protein